MTKSNVRLRRQAEMDLDVMSVIIYKCLRYVKVVPNGFCQAGSCDRTHPELRRGPAEGAGPARNLPRVSPAIGSTGAGGTYRPGVVQSAGCGSFREPHSGGGVQAGAARRRLSALRTAVP